MSDVACPMSDVRGGLMCTCTYEEVRVHDECTSAHMYDDAVHKNSKKSECIIKIGNNSSFSYIHLFASSFL